MSSEKIMEGAYAIEKGNCEETRKDTPQDEDKEMDDSPQGDSKDFEDASKNNQAPSQKLEEEVIKKKYGGLLPKKPPLISRDHEHAFFDSADWALGKKSKGPVEALRPKLQPSPHQQVRPRSAYALSDDEGDTNSDDHGSPENHHLETDVQKSDDNATPENCSLENQNQQI